jgi:hypothetical protein
MNLDLFELNLNKNLIGIINRYSKITYTDRLKNINIIHDKLIELWLDDRKYVPLEFDYNCREYCNSYGMNILEEFALFLVMTDVNLNNIKKGNKKYKIAMDIFKTLKFDTNLELICLALDIKEKN